jgi:5-methylcytosine-specific restriction enzyme A
MPTLLTTKQFKEILIDSEIIQQADLRLFQTIYSFDKHRASATQISKILGYKNIVVVNGQVSRIAKRIAKKHDIQFTVRQNQMYKYWDLFFTGYDEGKYFIWQLQSSLRKALKELSLTLEFSYPEELPIDTKQTYMEGLQHTIVVNAYERNTAARQKCIDCYGAICAVCYFDFEETYGDIGKDFIHVHHLKLLSNIGKMYEVDPVKDLRPVCPNCHSMLHKQEPPFTLEELRDKIRKKS